MPGAIDLKAYLGELAQKSGLDDASKAELLKVVEGNPKLAEGLSEGIMLRSDYSRGQDELRTKTAEFEGTKTQWTEWYKEATETDKARQTELVDLRAKVSGGNGGNGGGGGTPPAGLTQKQLDDALAKERSFGVNVAKTVGKITARHLHAFNEEPDFEAIEKIAMTDNISADAAYDKWVAPRIKEKSDKDLEDRIKRERAEAVAEALSKHNLPGESGPRTHHTFFDRDKVAATAPKDERARAESFKKAYETAGRSS